VSVVDREMDNLDDADTQNSESAIDGAYRAYEVGNSEPLYQAFVVQARTAVWKHVRRDDPTLCHQIAARAMLAVDKFRGESKLSTWFFRIAENECKRELSRLIKSRQRHVDLDSIEPGSKDSKRLLDDADRAFKASVVAVEAGSRLKELLARLPAAQAEAVLLRTRGCSMKEIAAKTGVSLATAASRLRLAKEKLEKNLTKSDKKPV
jgi:RNA polymerase sigma factor (sigma-70 family)